MDDVIKGTKKTIDITVQTAKMTAETLQEALAEFVSGEAKKVGNVSLGQLEKKGGKLESIEITDTNIRDFKSIAAKYDIDYALKRDRSTDPTTYHVYFQTANAENFKRAFSEYVNKKQEDISAHDDIRGRIHQKAQEIANQPRDFREHNKERKKEEVL